MREYVRIVFWLAVLGVDERKEGSKTRDREFGWSVVAQGKAGSGSGFRQAIN